ncbi:hypothetical protein [Ornithinimicrobium sp. LYQ103]|uniref:hypothetical protein n=1 Tax=Ornithinimicrobium sp. LYQ103 TaxID=3378796 RepID=UPI00385344D5
MSDQLFDQETSARTTKDVALDESKSVGVDAEEGARAVAGTAGAEAQHVAGEAKAQVASLYQQVRGDVTDQARTQQQRAAGGLHGLAGELGQMADGTPEAGLAAGLARQAAERVDGVAGWLEDREPADVLDDVRRYARRNPGTFLAVCAAVGFVGGRFTRGLRDDAQGEKTMQGAGYPVAGTHDGATYDATAYGTATYGTATSDGPAHDAATLADPPPSVATESGVASYGGRPGAGDPIATDVWGERR